MTSILSGIQTYLGRYTTPEVNTLIGTIEQLLGQLKRELDARTISIFTQTSIKQTGANLVETTLYTYTIQAGVLSNTGDYVFRFNFFGSKPNLNTVDLKLYLNNVLICSITSALSGVWELLDKIAVHAGAWISLSGNSGAIDFTVNQVVKLTATNHIASDADLVLNMGTFELLGSLT